MGLYQKFLAAQLRRPSGWFGRWIMASKLNRLNRTMNELTLRELELPPAGGNVLEIGFGGGALIERILQAHPRVHVTGLELSQEMVESTGRRLRKLGDADRVRLVHGDAKRTPFADRSFLRIVTVNTLYFLDDPEAVLRECRRLLLPEGVLLICFNPKEELEKWPGHRHGFRLYTLNELKQLLHSAGFARVGTAEDRDEEQGLFYCVSAFVR